jgi:hypothetical protein
VVTVTSARRGHVSQVIERVARRPRGWVLRYLLTTVPALILALMLMVPLRPWFMSPLMIQALETRSLDHFLEAVQFIGGQIAGGPLLALAMLLIPLGGLLVRVLWVFMEGGILATYAGSAPLSWHEFFRVSWRFFGSLLLLGVIWLLSTAGVVVATVAVGLLARSLWYPLGVVVLSVGGVGLLLLWVWFSMARSVTVVRDERNVIRALRRAMHVIGQRPGGVLALVFITVALQWGLQGISRAGTAALPFSWWLPALVLQQFVAALAVGVTLARRAGEVGLAAQVFPQPMPGDVQASVDHLGRET